MPEHLAQTAPFLQGVLSAKQLQPALAGALTTLRSLKPQPSEAEAEAEPGKALVPAVGLVKCLGTRALEVWHRGVLLVIIYGFYRNLRVFDCFIFMGF